MASAVETDSRATVKHRVDALILEQPVLVFSKTYCPYCRMTKKLFAELELEPLYIELDRSQDGAMMQGVLQELTGQRTVPNIFIQGMHIGGNDKVHEMAAAGELQKLVGLAEKPPPPAVRSKSGRDLTNELSDGDMVKEQVKNLILGCPVVVFSKTYCPFCRRVKRLFTDLSEPICVIELDESADGARIQMVLQELTTQRTVPSVFVSGVHVGGNDDTQAKAKTGELQRMITAARG